MLSKINKPAFGINCGGVGFLTEIEHSDDLFDAIKNLENGNYTKQKLQRIDVYLNDLHVGTALNEVVLHSSRVAKIQGFEISIDNTMFRHKKLILIFTFLFFNSNSFAQNTGLKDIFNTDWLN